MARTKNVTKAVARPAEDEPMVADTPADMPMDAPVVSESAAEMDAEPAPDAASPTGEEAEMVSTVNGEGTKADETTGGKARRTRTPRPKAPLKYAYEYEEWRKVIKPFYVTINDIIKMKQQDNLHFVLLPENVTIPTESKLQPDRIYEAGRFTKSLGLQGRWRKGSSANKPNYTLKGLHNKEFVTFQVLGKHGRVADDEFQDIDEDDNYAETGRKWFELNRRGSYVGLNGCFLVDASKLFDLPKIFVPRMDDEDTIMSPKIDKEMETEEMNVDE